MNFSFPMVYLYISQVYFRMSVSAFNLYHSGWIPQMTNFEIFSYFFFQETGFDISCILSPNVKLFSGRKKWINMLSTEIAQSVLTINFQQMTFWKFFFSENWIWHFMHMVSNRDSLHEMSNSVGWKTKKSIKYIVCWNCPDSGKGEELQNYFCTEKLST